MNIHAEEAKKGAIALGRGAGDNNPFKFAYELIERNPGKDFKAMFEMFLSDVEDLPDVQRAVYYYFFKNAHDYALTSRNRHREPEHRSQAAQQRKTQVQQFVNDLLLLDLTMPNGKAMRDCTGAEMAKFGNRYQRIAEKVGKTKTVGLVLSEDQVKAIMK